jgi:hypothetical protein
MPHTSGLKTHTSGPKLGAKDCGNQKMCTAQNANHPKNATRAASFGVTSLAETNSNPASGSATSHENANGTCVNPVSAPKINASGTPSGAARGADTSQE